MDILLFSTATVYKYLWIRFPTLSLYLWRLSMHPYMLTGIYHNNSLYLRRLSTHPYTLTASNWQPCVNGRLSDPIAFDPSRSSAALWENKFTQATLHADQLMYLLTVLLLLLYHAPSTLRPMQPLSPAERVHSTSLSHILHLYSRPGMATTSTSTTGPLHVRSLHYHCRFDTEAFNRFS
jgi:hypothetical protein